ncbi:MAG: hypothetical protein GY861_10730 [bacterium]|nr:hypothetical protein [bacterium]
MTDKIVIQCHSSLEDITCEIINEKSKILPAITATYQDTEYVLEEYSVSDPEDGGSIVVFGFSPQDGEILQERINFLFVSTYIDGGFYAYGIKGNQLISEDNGMRKIQLSYMENYYLGDELEITADPITESFVKYLKENSAKLMMEVLSEDICDKKVFLNPN